MWLIHEIKVLLNCASKATFSKFIIRFFYKQHFYMQRQAEIGKKIANAKQHPEAELLTGKK